jgi:Flp pilus assembly protein TadD
LYQSDVQLARIYETLGHWDEAIREREQAIAVNPDDTTLLIDLGNTLMKAGRLDRAQEVLGQAVESAPRDARAPLSLSLVAMQRGDSVTARSALTRFLAIAPSSFSQQIESARQRLAQLSEPH